MKKIKSFFGWVGIILIIIFVAIVLFLAWITDIIWLKIIRYCLPKLYQRIEKRNEIRKKEMEEELNKRTQNQGWAWQPKIFDN